MIVFTTVGKARVIFLVLPRCHYGACRPVCAGFTTVVYGGVLATAGHASSYVPVFPGIENNSKRRETNHYRDVPGHHRVKPGFTVNIFGVWF